jgi:hypothetical protein
MNPPSYTLRVSVKVLGKEPIEGLEAEPSIAVGQITVTVKQRWPFLILLAHNFTSEAGAEAFLNQIKCGLWNIAIKHNIAFTPYFERRDITPSADPEQAARNLAKTFRQPIKEPIEPVHGLTEEEGYTIFPTGENIRYLTLEGGLAYASTGWDAVSQTLAEGLQKAQNRPKGQHTILATAIDLYLAHFYESSIRARFLTLIVCLEVLAPVTERHPGSVLALTDFKHRVKAQLIVVKDAEERDALKALLREIGFKKETSIRRRLRSLVIAEAPLAQRDRKDFAKKVVKAYDLRGTVVHTGVVELNKLNEAYSTALEAVRLLLRARLGLADQ